MNAIPEKALHPAIDWNATNADGKRHLRLGLDRERAGDDAGAESCYLRAASCANAVALYRLGLLELRKGTAFAGRAARFFTRATILCFPPAADELWKLHRENRLPPDAAGWFADGVRFHAERGHAWAQRFAALCFGEGVGVPRDDATAVDWLRKAARAGDPQAWRIALDWMDGGRLPAATQEERAEACRLAADRFRALMRRTASPRFQTEIAWATDVMGQGWAKQAFAFWRRAPTPRDILWAHAIHLYRRAAELGDIPALRRLARYSFRGYGIEKNYWDGYRCVDAIVKKSGPSAYREFGDWFWLATEKEQSRSAACELYRRGAAAGDAVSRLRFADCYEYGVSVKTDSVAAEMLREKALRDGDPAAILPELRRYTSRRFGRAWRTRIDLPKAIRMAEALAPRSPEAARRVEAWRHLAPDYRSSPSIAPPGAEC